MLDSSREWGDSFNDVVDVCQFVLVASRDTKARLRDELDEVLPSRGEPLECGRIPGILIALSLFPPVGQESSRLYLEQEVSRGIHKEDATKRRHFHKLSLHLGTPIRLPDLLQRRPVL
jgi:hypothetical protein